MTNKPSGSLRTGHIAQAIDCAATNKAINKDAQFGRTGLSVLVPSVLVLSVLVQLLKIIQDQIVSNYKQ